MSKIADFRAAKLTKGILPFRKPQKQGLEVGVKLSDEVSERITAPLFKAKVSEASLKRISLTNSRSNSYFQISRENAVNPRGPKYTEIQHHNTREI
ncbi:hypothetical protein H0H87_001036 [Tephrocybe sp. NHM501043]|nr:hypothetical protein H0H87_001036 [Tephrocybe sp. NHM501043]